MSDIMPPDRRSQLMARVGSRDTKPELAVRKVAHRLGFRFRLHRSDLPGRPDIVFPRLRKVLFVHGCFWHQHPGCYRASLPKTNTDFWQTKLANNVLRDERNATVLRAAGWTVGAIWECETRSPQTLRAAVRSFLCDASSSSAAPDQH